MIISRTKDASSSSLVYWPIEANEMKCQELPVWALSNYSRRSTSRNRPMHSLSVAQLTDDTTSSDR